METSTENAGSGDLKHVPIKSETGSDSQNGQIHIKAEPVSEVAEIQVKTENPENAERDGSAEGAETAGAEIESVDIESAEIEVEGAEGVESAEAGADIRPKNVSADDLYRRLSQYEVWSFSSEELEQKKRQTNAAGAEKALQRFREAREAMASENREKFERFGGELGEDVLGLVTFEEEQKFVRFFGQQAVQICAHFNMPTQVKATAVQFLRRFYLVHSVMEYRPKNVLYAVVFLLAKLENFFVSIESFAARLPKTKPDDILLLEFVVLQALQFALLVHHPFRPIYGFFLDMQHVLLHPEPVMYDVNMDTIGQLHDAGKRWLNEHALLLDVAFLFLPPQIALAALFDTNKKVTERYLKIKYLGDDSGRKGVEVASSVPGRPAYDAVLKAIKRCIAVAHDTVDTSREESTAIDEKSFFCINPQKLLKKRLKAAEAESQGS